MGIDSWFPTINAWLNSSAHVIRESNLRVDGVTPANVIIIDLTALIYKAIPGMNDPNKTKRPREFADKVVSLCPKRITCKLYVYICDNYRAPNFIRSEIVSATRPKLNPYEGEVMAVTDDGVEVKVAGKRKSMDMVDLSRLLSTKGGKRAFLVYVEANLRKHAQPTTLFMMNEDSPRAEADTGIIVALKRLKFDDEHKKKPIVLVKTDDSDVAFLILFHLKDALVNGEMSVFFDRGNPRRDGAQVTEFWNLSKLALEVYGKKGWSSDMLLFASVLCGTDLVSKTSIAPRISQGKIFERIDKHKASLRGHGQLIELLESSVSFSKFLWEVVGVEIDSAQLVRVVNPETAGSPLDRALANASLTPFDSVCLQVVYWVSLVDPPVNPKKEAADGHREEKEDPAPTRVGPKKEDPLTRPSFYSSSSSFSSSPPDSDIMEPFWK